MATTGHSARQRSPNACTEVDLMLCLPKRRKVSCTLSSQVLKTPQCFCLHYMFRRAIPHIDHPLCEKMSNICTEFLLRQQQITKMNKPSHIQLNTLHFVMVPKRFKYWIHLTNRKPARSQLSNYFWSPEMGELYIKRDFNSSTDHPIWM